MHFEATKILQLKQYKKSGKALFAIYVDLECLKEKNDAGKNNPENSSTTKVGGHMPQILMMSTIPSFKTIESKHDVYRNKDCIKKFCKSL